MSRKTVLNFSLFQSSLPDTGGFRLRQVFLAPHPPFFGSQVVFLYIIGHLKLQKPGPKMRDK